MMLRIEVSVMDTNVLNELFAICYFPQSVL